MEIISNCKQGADEWHDHRLASVGSTAINLIAPQGKGYKKTLYEFVGEYVTGERAESFKFKHADRGHEFEPVARNHYEAIKELGLYGVKQVALIKGDKPHQHYSPDGLVGDRGTVEIKVRIPSIFIEASEKGYFPIADKRQIQWGLYISKRSWCDRVQYCPEMEKAKRKAIIIDTIQRDEETISELKTVADKFIADMLGLAKKY